MHDADSATDGRRGRVAGVADVLIGRAEDGERLGSARLLVATDDLYVAEYTLDPGGEPGTRHYHEKHSDSFYVLEGELEFPIAGGTTRAGPGTMLSAPRGAIHAFPVAIGEPARFLNMHTPGGFETYMREMVARRERGEPLDEDFLRSHDIFEVPG